MAKLASAEAKAKAVARSTRYRARHLEKYNAARRVRAQTPEGKVKVAVARKRFYARRPEKAREYEARRVRVKTPEAKAKAAAHARHWRARHPEKIRTYREKHAAARGPRAATLRRKYGLTLAQYDAMLAAQRGCCAICKAGIPGGRGDWCVDHDHGTNAVRGLLCSPCNVGLGAFKDNTVSLRDAALYLENSRGRI